MPVPVPVLSLFLASLECNLRGTENVLGKGLFTFYQAKLVQNHVPENYSRSTGYFLKLLKKT